MKTVFTIVAVILIVFGAYFSFVSFMRHSYLSAMSNALFKGDVELFDKLASQKATIHFVPAYNLLYLKMNKAMMLEKDKEMEKLIRSSRDIRMTNQQKKSMNEMVFYYYISVQKNDEAKAILSELASLPGFEMDEKMKMYVDTYLEHKATYLEDAMKLYEQKPANASELAILIAGMYENLHDEAQAKKYYEIAENRFSELNKMK